MSRWKSSAIHSLELLICVAVVLSAGCTGRSATAPARPPLLGPLPPPRALGPARDTSSFAINGLEGNEFSPASGSQMVTASGSNCQFTPNFPAGSANPLGLSYALYGFSQAQYLLDPDLHLEWITPPAEGDLWVGFSNYANNTWVFRQPAGSVSDIAIEDLPGWMSPGPDSHFFVALILTGQGQSVLDFLRIGKIWPADSILAIPSKTQVSAGDFVTITVFANETAGPLQFSNASIVMPASCSYVPNSYNVGVEGGSSGFPDGLYGEMAPSGGMLVVPDSVIVPTDLGGGLIAYDFGAYPIGGSDLSLVSGALFNFQIEVQETTSLAFRYSGTAPHFTYYSDSTAAEYGWSDLTNFGVPSIEVDP